MPLAPLRPCAYPRCPALVRGAQRCPEHTQGTDAQRATRPSAHARGYTHAWSEARTLFLKQHPLCATCLAAGRVVPAQVVDHVVPHRGDQGLFWDERNWQPLCDWRSPHNCQGKKTSREANALQGRAAPRGVGG